MKYVESQVNLPRNYFTSNPESTTVSIPETRTLKRYFLIQCVPWIDPTEGIPPFVPNPFVGKNSRLRPSPRGGWRPLDSTCKSEAPAGRCGCLTTGQRSPFSRSGWGSWAWFHPGIYKSWTRVDDRFVSYWLKGRPFEGGCCNYYTDCIVYSRSLATVLLTRTRKINHATLWSKDDFRERYSDQFQRFCVLIQHWHLRKILWKTVFKLARIMEENKNQVRIRHVYDYKLLKSRQG